MNELNELGRINSALARRYGGQSPLIYTMASDAFPMLPVSDEQLDPELHWLAQSRLCYGIADDAADAGNQSAVYLRNPSTSGVIAVVSFFNVFVDTAGTVYVRVQDLGTTSDGEAAAYLRDGRGNPSSPVGRSSCLVGSASGAYSAVAARLRLATANVPLEHSQVYVLTPGTRLTLATAVVNNGIHASFWWRERAMVSQEGGG